MSWFIACQGLSRREQLPGFIPQDGKAFACPSKIDPPQGMRHPCQGLLAR